MLRTRPNEAVSVLGSGLEAVVGSSLADNACSGIESAHTSYGYCSFRTSYHYTLHVLSNIIESVNNCIRSRSVVETVMKLGTSKTNILLKYDHKQYLKSFLNKERIKFYVPSPQKINIS
jgi:hypothetical protein